MWTYKNDFFSSLPLRTNPPVAPYTQFKCSNRNILNGQMVHSSAAFLFRWMLNEIVRLTAQNLIYDWTVRWCRVLCTCSNHDVLQCWVCDRDVSEEEMYAIQWEMGNQETSIYGELNKHNIFQIDKSHQSHRNCLTFNIRDEFSHNNVHTYWQFALDVAFAVASLSMHKQSNW